MRNVIQFFINRPVWTNAFIVVILMFGFLSLFTMQRSFFPELDPNRIIVSVFYPGASPQEMENGVTIKIEQAVKGLQGIEEVNSTSSENFTQIDIKAYQDTDMEDLLSEVENAVNSINSFPQGVERPIIRRLKSNGMSSTVAFVGISLENESIPVTELTDMTNKVERDLLNSREITQIEKQGFPEKEISISVREQDLLRYQISMQEVALAVGSKNIDITAGIIRGGVEEMNIRSNNRTTTPEEIGEIIVRTDRNGNVVRVKDVADIKLGYQEGSQESTFNGKPSVSFQIEKTTDQDISKITKFLHDYQEKFNKENPDFKFNIFFEFNNMLNDRIDLLTRNGLMGLILVLLFLGLFLNLKLSAWVAFGIPFSFLGMFIIGAMYGISINMISLFGMILVVGILVDDGIVIAENIYTHYEMGKSAMKAAIDGTMEVMTSVFTSVLTTIVAFTMLLFVEGLEMMREMAFVVIACLAFSLFEAFLVLPGHLGHKKVLSESKDQSMNLWLGIGLSILGIVIIYIGTGLFPEEFTLGMVLFPFTLIITGALVFFAGFTKSRLESMIRGGADRGIKYFRDEWFKAIIHNIIGTGKKRWYILGFFAPMIFTILTISLLVGGVISATFFPNIQPDFFTIEVAYKPGDNKAKTQEFLQEATKILIEENQRIIKENGDSLLNYYSTNVGFSMSLGQSGNHAGMISVYFDAENSKTPVDTLMNRINRRIKSIDQGRIAQDLYVGGFNRFGKEIEVGLTSANEANLQNARRALKDELVKMDGVFNIKDNMPPGRNEVYLTLKPEAEIHGLTKNEVLSQIRSGFFGQEAQRLIIGTDEVKIWVRYPLEDRNSLQDLEKMKIKTTLGHQIPLVEIADFVVGRAPESLKRRNGQRIIRVDAECTDPDLVAKKNTQIFDSIIPKITQTYGDVSSIKLGQFERSQKTGKSMMIILVFGLIVMIILLTLHFNSFGSALLIMLVIPAGIAGAIMGHGLLGKPVSILSAFGMIALVGVLVNDSIVFLDRYGQLLREGESVKTAALNAAVSRFRPILLTSLTTVAGLLPIIAEKSMQAQFLIPMGISIAFGVLFGTLFILIFYPAAIIFWNRARMVFSFIFNWEMPQERQVEPALKLMKDENDNEEE